MTITGASAADTIVDAEQKGSGFTINSGVSAIIRNITIQNGKAVEGGGIYNNGTLTVQNSTLSGNSATYDGGGIYNPGHVDGAE